MPRAASARRYAQAVFQLALEKEDLDGWLEDLTFLASTLESADLSEFLDAPQVAVSKKVDLIKQTLGDTIGSLALNLLSLLASRNITYLMPHVVEQYQRLLDVHRGIERAEVVSATRLDSEQIRRITDLLKGVVGKDVDLTSRVEPQVLGGFVAQVGDRVIDGSTRTKLSRMRRELVQQQ